MKLENIKIRETDQNDLDEIFRVEKEAFGSEEEAKLALDLIADKSAEPLLSLLALDKGKAIGHILFTRIFLDSKENKEVYHCLAPLAVVPDFQSLGIGGLLIKEGLKSVKKMGSKLVFVLGHPEYYPKHGFIPNAEKLGFSAPFEIPAKNADAWMVHPLGISDLSKFSGKVICADELNKPELWRE